MDDICPTGPTEIDARQASQGMAKESAHRGIQDAARKRRDVSQTPGAWAGPVVHTTDSPVTIMVEQTKWDKTKVKLQWVSSRLDEGPDVEHKTLERIRGFLNYVMQVYPAMIPYLRGFHGTLDSWRSNRTADGFDKRVNSELEPEGIAKQPKAKRRKTSHFSDQTDRDAESEEIGFDGAVYTDPKFGLGNDDEDSEAED